MLSKNNRKLQERKLEQKQRFGFRKYSFGLASALIGVSFMLTTGGTVSADTTTPAETTVAAAATTSTSGDATSTTASSESTDAKSSEATDTASTTSTTDSSSTSEATATTSSESTDSSDKSTATDSSDTKTESTTSETSDSKSESTTTDSATDTAKTASTESTSSENKTETATSDSSADQSASSATSDSTSEATNALKAATTATDASVNTTDASTTTANDDSVSSEGKITDEGKAKGLTDSDVSPEISDANGASLVLDNSNIPSGYKADPTEGRYTFGIVSVGEFTTQDGTTLGGFELPDENNTTYNSTHDTKYYLRFSTSKTAVDGKYDDTVYAQVVDAVTGETVKEYTLTPNGTATINEMKNLVKLDNSTHYYQLTYTVLNNNGVSTKQIDVNSDVGTQYSKIIYDAGIDTNTSSGTVVHVMYPEESTITTQYIAKDAAGNETVLANYEETGREGFTYTASGERSFKGYDLISVPSSTTGTLSASYKIGDLLGISKRQLSNYLQIARVHVVTDTDGTAKVELRVATLDASLDDIADSSVWKTILSTEPVAPGEFATSGNVDASGNPDKDPKTAFLLQTLSGDKIGWQYVLDAGFTEEQLDGAAGYLTIFGLNNRLSTGQESVKYYYAPQGQVRINYVTSDGTVIQAPVSAYENSGANTSYDVTGSTYRPETITVNGKTYRYVKSDKSMGTAGTTEVNGYTYNVTPSDATGTITSNTVNDVYYVYEQVTYHTEAETKDVTRTIEYYDSVTGEPIPSNLESTVTQTATLNRNKIYDDQNNFIGYGTISADGSSYTIDDSWTVDAQTWTQQDSADLSDYGYTAPDRASVAAVTVDGNTTAVTEKVYYGHQTTPVTPENPGTPGEPINPKGDVTYPDGVSKDDLTSTVKRTINYVDEDGNAVNGSPNGTSSYEQTAEFTRTAIVDKVTGKILGYDTNNDGKVDTESADRAWLPTEQTLEAVKSADPSSVGYDNVDISNVSSLLVTPDQADTTVTVTYSKTTYTLKDEETKTVTRTINYVDSVTGEAIPSELEPSVTQTATLTRSVIYDNKGNKIGYGTVSEDGTSYTLDDSWKVADQTWTEQKSADLSDYGYTAPDKETVAAETVDGSTTDTVVTVYYGHQTTPVTPENPGTPGEPINPKGDVTYPDGVSKDDLTSTVKRTINYVDEDGNAVNGSPNGTSSYEQTAEFTRTAIVDKVTGKILGYDTDNDGNVDTESADRAWLPTSKTLEAVKSADPSSVGYDNVDISNVSSLVVTPGQGDTTVTVTYSNNQVSGTIKYIDDTTGVELDSDTLPTGKVGSTINYTTADKIKSYEDQGYELVSNDFTDGSQVYAKEGNDFVVHLKHQTQTITPNDPNPVTPGEPINPNDPNSPVYGEETDRKNLVKDASQTIHYVGAGDDTPADNVVTQKDAFTRTVTIDKVTGKVLSYTDWEGEKTFDTVDTPVVDGYHADKKVAGGLTATVDNPDVEETVTYTPNGKLIPVDEEGNQIPGTDTPTYTTDPTDPTKVLDPTVPNVDGWTPKNNNVGDKVTPEDPGKDTPVVYNQVVTGTIKYVDDTTGKTLSSEDLPEGTVGSTINYTTADKIKNYEDQGYELVSNDFTDGSQVYEKDGNDFVVHLKHATEQTTSYKDATQTIHYVGAGDDTPADKVQTQKDAFTKTDTIDKVTGEVIETTGWTGAKTFGTEDTPVVDGYHADKKVAGGLTATVDNPDVEETVTYSPNGKLVPVDPNGTPIPGADTPTYPTDPNDPTKVVPNEPIPEVPGWNPVDPSPVTPTNPGEDTPVPYTKDETPEVKYGLTEKFVDEEGNELLPSVNKGTDYKTGDSYDVTKDAKVVEGYVLVKTTDVTGTFTDSDKTAVFTYKKVGKIVPVDPNGNEIPGADTPSYKNDPDDPTKVVPNEPTPEVPGWTTDVPNVTPEDPTKDTPVPYTKNETPAAKYGLTEKFVDEDGNELLPSVNKGTDYKTGDSYDVTKDAKVVEGYVLVKTTDTTGTFTDSDKTAVFTYKKVGKIIPVDENGTPIPGADTPSYKNDPTDPTKVVPNEPTPEVPGWTTDVPNVTPEDPTKDTPVPYTKKITPETPSTPETPAAKYGLTEKFVDENGNELQPSVNKGTDYKTGDSYDVTGDAKVVEGYVLVKTTDTTGTFTDGNKTAVFTYKKIGKIIPVDENGTPIPGADTPSYKNDPTDPTKVLPNEPTPEVPGWTTDVPNVTPEDPTADTPVPYAKKTTPSTPEVPSTPDTPSNPEEPTTPDTPSNPETPTTPDKPEVPSQPQKPATPSGQNNPTPVNPTTTPASPKQTTLTGKQTPAPSKTVTANQLPQTGADEEKANLLSALGLGLVTLTSLFGLLGGKKRKH